MNKIIELSNKIVKAVREFEYCWRVGGIVSSFVITLYIYLFRNMDTKTIIFGGIVLVLFIILVWIFVFYYNLKDRWKKASRSFEYIHFLTHYLRSNIGKRCRPQWPSGWNKDLINEHVREALTRILDDGANCLSEMTGQKIISCLVMPVGIQKGSKNLLFQTVLYGGNPSSARVNGSEVHERDLIQQAFRIQRPIIHSDYEKEYKEESAKGNLILHRSNWRDYYMSSLMTSFSVGDTSNPRKVWGVLSFDCIKKGVFKKDWQDLACAFSDALGLVLSLEDPYRNEWSDSEVVPSIVGG